MRQPRVPPGGEDGDGADRSIRTGSASAAPPPPREVETDGRRDPETAPEAGSASPGSRCRSSPRRCGSGTSGKSRSGSHPTSPSWRRPLHPVQEPAMREGVPRQRPDPRVHRPCAKGKFIEAARKIKGDERPSGGVRPRLPPGGAVRDAVRPRKKGEPVAIGASRTVRRRLRARHRDVEIRGSGRRRASASPVVGAGPAGLTVARRPAQLVQIGHDVTIFRGVLHKPGGVLMYGIPEFRLPKEIVQAEVGVHPETGREAGMQRGHREVDTIDELLSEEGFDAVFRRHGRGLPYFMNIPGENLIGVYSANEYLTRRTDEGVPVPRVRYPARTRRRTSRSSGRQRLRWTRRARRSGWGRSTCTSSIAARRRDAAGSRRSTTRQEEWIEFTS